VPSPKPTAHTSRLRFVSSYSVRKPTVTVVTGRKEVARDMVFSNLIHLKTLLMVLTAAAGSVAGGTMANSMANNYLSGSRSSPSFILTLDPTTMMLGQNASATSTVNVMSVNGYSGTVGLSLFYPGTKVTSTLTTSSVSVPANGIVKSTISLTAPSTLGNYTIVIVGVSGGHSKTSYATAVLTVQVMSNQDFSISANPFDLIGLAGASNTTSITVTSMNGYTGTISLTATAPFGYITVTGGQTPLTLSSGGTAISILFVSTSLANTSPGTYTIAVTGTAGHRTHTTTVTVVVQDPTPPPAIVESLKLIGYTFNNGTTLTMTFQNTGNTATTLASYSVRDSSGDAWSLMNWNSITIAPGATGTATVLIGLNCPTCVYTGITGLFFQFAVGQTYTVQVTTAANNQFSFTVTR
jgi:hypothetical protein